MTFLSWNDDYLIGDATIDTEHRELFRLINEFHSRWQAGRERREIALVLTQLVRYAEEHFQHEEALMAAAGYPLLDEHRRVHEELVESIFVLHEEYVKQEGNIELKTMKFVRNWLVEHIVHNDYLFRDYLAKPTSG